MVATYTVSDGKGGTDDATVSIEVTSENDDPVGNDTGVDAFTTLEDDPITLTDNKNVLDNDTDPDGDILSVTQFVVNAVTYPVTAGSSASVNLANIGTVTIHSNGDVEFVPVLNYNDAVPTITYTVSDGTGGLATATLNIIITPVNDDPVAGNDSFTTPEDVNLTTENVLTNDSDVDIATNDGDVLTVTQFVVPGDITIYAAGAPATIPGIGTLVINANGSFTFTPALNYNNNIPELVATYTVSDGKGGTDDATVSIRVTPLNDPPLALNDTITTAEDTPSDAFDILANDTDVDNTLNVTSVDLDPATSGTQTTFFVDTKGTFTASNSGFVVFTPVANYFNDPYDPATWVIATYTVGDVSGALSNSARIRVIVTPVNDPPKVQDQELATNEDVPLTFCITVEDIEDNVITVGGIDQISDDGSTYVPGTVTPGPGISTEICFLLTPEENFNSGLDAADVSEWKIAICDNAIPPACTTITVIIRVYPQNDPPVAVNDTITTDEDAAVTFNILEPKSKYQNDYDVDTALDPDNKINPASVDLNPATPAEDKTVTVAGEGTFTVDGLGNVTYAPYLNFDGPSVTIPYTVKDFGGLSSNSANITVNINALNDAPVIEPFDYTPPLHYVYEDSVFDASDNPEGVCLSVTDIDGDVIIYNPNPINIKGDGSMVLRTDNFNFCYIFTPETNYNGESIWEFSVSDGTVAVSAQIKLLVLPVNDMPIAVDDEIEVTGNKTTKISSSFVLSNDSPLELMEPYNYTEFNDIYSKKKNGEDSVDVLFVRAIVTQPQFGTVYLNVSGDTIQYAPNTEFVGTDSFEYRVCDSGVTSLCDTATVYIVVDYPEWKIYEAVSPNNDEKNDYWRIDGIEEHPSLVRVFDRFNNLVYETENYDNEAGGNNWRGQASRGLGSDALPEGTYYYSIYLRDTKRTFSGFVILKRN